MNTKNKLYALGLCSLSILAMTSCSSKSTTSTTPQSTYVAPTPSISTVTVPTPTITPEPEVAVDLYTSASREYHNITTINGSGDEIDIIVDHFPQKIVFLDYIALDICAGLGLLDSFNFLTVREDLPEYLIPHIYIDSPDLSDYMHENDLSAIIDLEPQLIFSGPEASGFYDELSAIAPTISYQFQYQPSTYESFKTLSRYFMTVFGSDLVSGNEKMLTFFDQRLMRLQYEAEGQSAIILRVTDDGATLLGDNGICSMIFNDFGFVNYVGISEEIPFDFTQLSQINPDYLFLLNQSTLPTADIQSNFLTDCTASVIPLNTTAWGYMEGGLMAMDIMMADLESHFEVELPFTMKDIENSWMITENPELDALLLTDFLMEGLTMSTVTPESSTSSPSELSITEGEETNTSEVPVPPEVQPETLPDVQPETLPEVQPETLPDVQAETLPDIQPETLPDVQAETLPDVQAEIFPDVQPETLPDTHEESLPLTENEVDLEEKINNLEEKLAYLEAQLSLLLSS